ncbi:MAG: hypothetical protein EBV05_08190 [Cyanobacteria bacterium WB6_1B_304]|nr:hypothetical protein [Cyanobacteria bacterium WB6_1B_304]
MREGCITTTIPFLPQKNREGDCHTLLKAEGFPSTWQAPNPIYIWMTICWFKYPNLLLRGLGWLTDKSCTPSPPTPLPGGEGSRSTPRFPVPWERARVRAFGVLAEKFYQSIRGLEQGLGINGS